MILSKLNEHEVFKALSEPIRLRILALLTAGELCVCDLTEVLGLPQSTVSRHMNRLKTNKIVADRRAGKWVHYLLDKEFLRTFPELESLLHTMVEREPYRTERLRLQEYLKHRKC